jgi:ribonucleoside-diphosphate reductase alpha chain
MKQATDFIDAEEAKSLCLEYFGGDELAATTWINKYAMRDASGNLLESSPEDMHRRMATEFASIELLYQNSEQEINKNNHSDYGKQREFLSFEKILKLFRNFKYVIPQGSVMAALGNPHMFASLSNCVVLPEIYDSYGGIFYTDQQLAQLFKRRCGVGIDISTLRPAGASVSNAAGSSTGAVSFMERFSNTTREVSQNGRRGALMITMDIAHPDILNFITVKQDLSKVTGANISIRLTDKFMEAVSNNSTFNLQFPVDANVPEYTQTINAAELWNKIIECAHKTAEPGLIFWDRQHFYSTSSVYPGFKNISTNPCSEIAMQGGDSCRLIALNLFNFVEDAFTASARFDYKLYYEITYESQRLMDDLVDLELEAIKRILQKVESDPEPQNIKQVELNTWKLLYEQGSKGRRTGLGFTALADALAALNLKYDSAEAAVEIEKIMRIKCRAEFDSSIDLAIERGKFSAFDPAVENSSEFVQMLKVEFPQLYYRMMKYGRRNISISTVAPTGTLSLLAQSSSGLEPVFMLSYKRRRKISSTSGNVKIDFTDQSGDEWQEFEVYHHKLRDWMKVSGKTDVSKSPYYNSTAGEINWQKRVEMQAIVQKYTTHSISSTINLPASATPAEVSNIYLQAWKKSLKGITVYRDGSRAGVLLASEPDKDISSLPPQRPEILEAEVVRFMNHDEKWIAVVGLLEGKPYEIFTGREDPSFSIPGTISKGWVKKTKTDGLKRYDFLYDAGNNKINIIEGLSRTFNKEYWNYAKLISGVLRHGMPLPKVVDLVSNLNLYSESINTWKTGVERTLKRFIPTGTSVDDHSCPDCGSPDGLIYEEGCIKCKNCGSSKCG